MDFRRKESVNRSFLRYRGRGQESQGENCWDIMKKTRELLARLCEI